MARMSDHMSQEDYLRHFFMDTVINCPVCGNRMEEDCRKCGDCGLINDLWM